MLARPRLRRSWRSRHDPHSGIRDSLPSHCRSAAGTFGASCYATSESRPFSVLCLVCSPLSVPPILLSAFSALPAFQID